MSAQIHPMVTAGPRRGASDTRVSKSTLFSQLAALADDDLLLVELAAVFAGTNNTPPEPWLNLKEVSEAVGKHYVWLSKLRVPEVCGEYLAGGRSYKLSRVVAYLQSAECRARVAFLREQRKSREALKKAA